MRQAVLGPARVCVSNCGWNLLQATGEGEVDDVRDEGQSCREARAAWKEVERANEISVGEPEFQKKGNKS